MQPVVFAGVAAMLRSLSASLFCLFFSVNVSADECDGILNSSLMDTSTVIDKSAARSAFASSFCNKTFSEASSSGSTEAAAEYGIDISGSYAQKEAKFNQFKNENCGSSSSSDAQDRYYLSAQRALKASAVQAWSTCKQNKQWLSCWMSPTSDQSVVRLVLNWNPAGSKTGEVSHSLVLNGTNATFPQSPNIIYAPKSKMARGKDSIDIIRTDKRTVHVNLTVLYDNDHNESCQVTAPYIEPIILKPAQLSQPKTPLDRFNANGKWCMTGVDISFSWEKQGNSFKRTTTPKPTAIPAPWGNSFSQSVRLKQPDQIETTQMLPSQPGTSIRVIETYEIIDDNIIELKSSVIDENGSKRSTPFIPLGRFARCS